MQALMELKLRIQVNLESQIILRLIYDNIIGRNWTHVKEIPNTNLLVSLQHSFHNSAKMAVFDISKKDQIQEIYSLGEVSGGTIIFFFPSYEQLYCFSRNWLRRREL